MLYPLTFQPIFKQRIWGGRKLEEIYQKRLPANVPIGESWEISDRPGDSSVIANGPLAGKDLTWLMTHCRGDLLGSGKAVERGFPLLIKILDCREKLSLQVHPPAGRAAELGGEPKTEMWYVAHAEPGAELYAGLRRGVTPAEFASKTEAGTVAESFHRLPVKPGDAMFLPSGRVHALGSGLVIFEIQQNSDTTYRVFDWNRLGLNGKPRELHIKESLASIDFDDFEPGLVKSQPSGRQWGTIHRLVENPWFAVEHWSVATGNTVSLEPGQMQVVGVIEGELSIVHERTEILLNAGRFSLIPACLRNVRLEPRSTTKLLWVR